MAYVANLTDEEKKKQESTAPSTSGVVDSNIGAVSNSGAPAVDTKAPTSSGFVNLSRYLDVNQGAGAKLATDTTADLSKAVDAYSTTAADTVKTASDAYKTAAGDDAASKINDRLTKDASAAQKEAAKFLGGKFGGPDVGNYTASLADTQSDLNATLGSVTDVNAQRAALKDTYGKDKTYTSGFSMLDSFLMGGDQSGRDKLNQVKGRTAEVDRAYQGAEKKLTTAEQQARAAYGANQDSIRDNAGNLRRSKLTDASTRLADLNKTINPNWRGSSKGSLGDIFSDDDIADLQALNSLSGGKENDNWYAKTFNKGKAVEPTANESVAKPKSAPRPSRGKPTNKWTSTVAKAIAASAKAGKDISDTTKKAGGDAATQGKKAGGIAAEVYKDPIGAAQKYLPIPTVSNPMPPVQNSNSDGNKYTPWKRW